MTWGTLRPVILLPSDALSWPREQLRAALLHELAHVRRHDSFSQTLSRVASALYWPNPLAWFGARALRREAEIAADDAVIHAGVRPSAYAGQLLQLATIYRHADAGLSMASKTALEARMKSVLAPDQFRRGVSSMDVVKIAGTGLLAAAALAFVRPSLADDRSPPAPTPAVAAAPANPPAVPPAVSVEQIPPPAPAAPEAPPAPPAAAVPPTPPSDTHYAINMRGDLGRTRIVSDMRRMTPAERRKLHHILHNLPHEIETAMIKARPEIDQAMTRMLAHREEMKNLRPQIEQAMRDAKPEIERAMAEMRAHEQEMKNLRPRIEEALREVSPEIVRAMRETHEANGKAHVNEKARRHIEEAMRRMEMRMHEHRAMRDAMHDGETETDEENSERAGHQEELNEQKSESAEQQEDRNR